MRVCPRPNSVPRFHGIVYLQHHHASVSRWSRSSQTSGQLLCSEDCKPELRAPTFRTLHQRGSESVLISPGPDRKGLLLLAKSVQEVRTEAAAAIELSAASAASPPASPSAASPAPPETTAPSLLHEEDAESRRPRSGRPVQVKAKPCGPKPLALRPQTPRPSKPPETEQRPPSPEPGSRHRGGGCRRSGMHFLGEG